MRYLIATLIATVLLILYGIVSHMSGLRHGGGAVIQALFAVAGVDIWLQVARRGIYRGNREHTWADRLTRLLTQLIQFGFAALFVIASINIGTSTDFGASDESIMRFAANATLAALLLWFGLTRLKAPALPAPPPWPNTTAGSRGRICEKALAEAAALELSDGSYRGETWARAWREAHGDLARARSIYVQLRAGELARNL